jgi:hypothetical protein
MGMLLHPFVVRNLRILVETLKPYFRGYTKYKRTIQLNLKYRTTYDIAMSIINIRFYTKFIS